VSTEDKTLRVGSRVLADLVVFDGDFAEITVYGEPFGCAQRARLYPGRASLDFVAEVVLEATVCRDIRASDSEPRHADREAQEDWWIAAFTPSWSMHYELDGDVYLPDKAKWVSVDSILLQDASWQWKGKGDLGICPTLSAWKKVLDPEQLTEEDLREMAPDLFRHYRPTTEIPSDPHQPGRTDDAGLAREKRYHSLGVVRTATFIRTSITWNPIAGRVAVTAPVTEFAVGVDLSERVTRGTVILLPVDCEGFYQEAEIGIWAVWVGRADGEDAATDTFPGDYFVSYDICLGPERCVLQGDALIRDSGEVVHLDSTQR
jgi:hypothetical protein